MSCLLASSQPHGLAILLQFGDQLIPLFDNVVVLLVLVVGPVCLDHAVDAIDSAGNAICRDEILQVTWSR